MLLNPAVILSITLEPTFNQPELLLEINLAVILVLKLLMKLFLSSLASLAREAHWLQDGLTPSNLKNTPFPRPTPPRSEKCKARGFTVIVDGRKSQWNTVKTVVLMLQVPAISPPTLCHPRRFHPDAVSMPFLRTWSRPRCRWCAWWNPTSSGTRRSRTSASGRRRTAWALRWVSLPAAAAAAAAAKLFTELLPHRWGVSVMRCLTDECVWKCKSSSVQESSGQPQIVACGRVRKQPTHKELVHNRPHLEGTVERSRQGLVLLYNQNRDANNQWINYSIVD